jgi:PAS domain S-box-containing protein
MAVPLRVLIVEDRQSDAELLIYALQHSGFTLDWVRVETASEYLVLLRPEIDVILADYSLPQFGAVEALRLLQERGLDIPFIVVTGTISEQVAVECMKQGAADYLLKDSLVRLGAAVSRALEDRWLRLEKRRAEEQLSYQANLLENISDAVISTDLDFIIQSWNRAAESIYGWQRAEAIGKRIHEIIPPEYVNGGARDSSLKLLFEQGYWEGEVVQPRKDNTQVNILSSVSLIKDSSGNPVGVVGVNRDITERKRAEAALLASEEKFGAVFRESLDMILIIDSDSGEILSANRATQIILGYDPDTLVGKPFSMLFSAEAPLSEPEFVHKLREKGSLLDSQIFVTADGSTRLIDVTATLISWGDRRAILATFRDITEQKRLEAELMEKELLRVALEKEQELGELKNRFMSTVSHEFRTPLAMILTSSELLERYYDKLSAERRAVAFDTIKAQVKHLGDMLDDISVIIKAQMGRLEFHPTPLDLEQLCRQVVNEIQTTIGIAHQLTFTCQVEFSNIPIDERLLQHILRNLLSNAVKYSPPGESVSVILRREGNQIVLEVQDHGIGIPAEDREHLFQPYYRAGNVGTISGTGLGLKIARDCAELHGGGITFVSEEGKGTTFTVRLPVLLDPRH